MKTIISEIKHKFAFQKIQRLPAEHFSTRCILNICTIAIIGLTSLNSTAQENYEIRKITFKGNKTLEKSYLLDKMALDEVSWVEKLVTKNEPDLYSKELIDLDLKRLTRIYQSEGFLHVQTSVDPPDVNDNKQTVKLQFNVEEGEPVVVDSVIIDITEEMAHVDNDSLLKKLNRKLNLVKGKRFRDEALDTDVQQIEDAFRSLGYAYVKAEYDLSLKPAESATGITYSVHPGPKSYFGSTSVSGNDHVTEKFIRKQLKYDEGDLYNKSRLNKTRTNLYRLQLFRVVSVLPQKEPETEKSPIPVEIYVEEAPRIDTRFGAGYGTEEKFRAFVDFNYRGFLGGARRINIYAKHSALEPYNLQLRWIQPQFLGINGSVSLNPFLKRNAEPGYNTRSYGINIPFTYLFTTSLNTKLTYYLEDVEQTVEPGDVEFTDYESDKFPYNKSGLLLGTVFDTSEPNFSPEKGMNVSLGVKLNGYIFGGSFNYTRLWGEFRTYHEIGKVIMAYRIMAGGIASSDTSGFIPVEDRFYSGGSTSIRGWARSQLGPKRESGTPLGGKSIFESNIEARYPLFWKLSAAAFFEAGNVWKPSYTYRFNDLGYAAGGGLRVETPIGPVRLDVGFPLWSDKTSPQFFISVGQAF